MTNGDLSFRLKEFSGLLHLLNKEVTELKSGIGVNELWDNADVIRYWKVSPRTLASWRSEGLIDYVQVGGKIWYTREARELFLKTNMVQTIKKGRDFDDGE